MFSKSIQCITSNTPVGPYITEDQFIAAVEGVFKDPNSLQSAWEQYTAVCYSRDQDPALLFKCSELDLIHFRFCLNDSWDKLREGGRVYDAQFHTWNVNQVWLLAHIHRGNQFMVLSELTEKHAECSYNSKSYSAFVKEIATTMKVGYEVVSIQYKLGQFITYLAPNKPRSELRKLTLQDCRVNDEDCANTLIRYNEMKLSYLRTSALAPSLSLSSDSSSGEDDDVSPSVSTSKTKVLQNIFTLFNSAVKEIKRQEDARTPLFSEAEEIFQVSL